MDIEGFMLKYLLLRKLDILFPYAVYLIPYVYSLKTHLQT